MGLAQYIIIGQADTCIACMHTCTNQASVLFVCLSVSPFKQGNLGNNIINNRNSYMRLPDQVKAVVFAAIFSYFLLSSVKQDHL